MTLGQRLPRLLIAGVFAIISTIGFRPIVAQNADSAAQQKADIEPKKRLAKGKPRTKGETAAETEAEAAADACNCAAGA
jgi:hypothetical protein